MLARGALWGAGAAIGSDAIRGARDRAKERVQRGRSRGDNKVSELDEDDETETEAEVEASLRLEQARRRESARRDREREREARMKAMENELAALKAKLELE